MSYADGLLATGERISHREKQHPFIFVWGARFAILAVIIAGLSLWLSTNFSGAFQTILGWVTAILFFGGIAVFIWTALRYINQEYVLTNRRVLQVEGVLNRKSTDSSLEKINDAVLTQSFLGRMFNFGDLTVLTASETGIDKMQMLRGPVAFKKAMLDAKHEYELEMEGGIRPPSPPIREGVPAGAAMAAGAAAPPIGGNPGAPPPPAPADPDEVTRTLASLADLRDRGAISPEEYERKKAELLARL